MDFEDQSEDLCNELFAKKVNDGDITYNDLSEEQRAKLFDEAWEDFASSQVDDAYDRWKDDGMERDMEVRETETAVGISHDPNHL